MLIYEGYLTFASKLIIRNFSIFSKIINPFFLFDINKQTKYIILDSKLIEKLKPNFFFFSKKEMISLSIVMLKRFIKKHKIKFEIKKQQQHICNKIFTKNKYQKYEMTDYQLKKILRNQNLIINESIHDINLPLLQTYIAKGNRGNLYFFITSSNRRISTQQALKKLSKLNNKFKLRFIKKKKNQTLVSDVNFSPLLLVIFKKRDLRCSWSIFDSHLLNKNVLVPSLTKNIFLELNYSSLIQFMTDHVKHVTYMNFPQQHF